MVIDIDLESPVIPQLIEIFHKQGLSLAKVASLLGISRTTLYNKYLSREKYLQRRHRAPKAPFQGAGDKINIKAEGTPDLVVEETGRVVPQPSQPSPSQTSASTNPFGLTQGVKIVITKPGRPKGSKTTNKSSSKQKSKKQKTTFWTQEEMKELYKMFGQNYKQVARAIKDTVKEKENKNLEVVKRLANEFRGKPVAYICKAIREGAYFRFLNQTIDDKWAQKQEEMEKKNPVQLTPEQMEESDRKLAEYMRKIGMLVTDEDLSQGWTMEMEWDGMRRSAGILGAIEYFLKHNWELPEKAYKDVEEHNRLARMFHQEGDIIDIDEEIKTFYSSSRGGSRW